LRLAALRFHSVLWIPSHLLPATQPVVVGRILDPPSPSPPLSPLTPLTPLTPPPPHPHPPRPPCCLWTTWSPPLRWPRCARRSRASTPCRASGRRWRRGSRWGAATGRGGGLGDRRRCVCVCVCGWVGGWVGAGMGGWGRGWVGGGGGGVCVGGEGAAGARAMEVLLAGLEWPPGADAAPKAACAVDEAWMYQRSGTAPPSRDACRPLCTLNHAPPTHQHTHAPHPPPSLDPQDRRNKDNVLPKLLGGAGEDTGEGQRRRRMCVRTALPFLQPGGCWIVAAEAPHPRPRLPLLLLGAAASPARAMCALSSGSKGGSQNFCGPLGMAGPVLCRPAVPDPPPPLLSQTSSSSRS
jgi:hypothetical protein